MTCARHPRRASRWADAARERGSGTVLALGAIGVLVVVTTAMLAVASALLAAHSARGAADLAALAAAQEHISRGSPGSACAAARWTAEHNGAALAGCEVGADGIARVLTRSPVTLRVPGLTPSHMHGEARAGPDPGLPAAGTPGQTGGS